MELGTLCSIARSTGGSGNPDNLDLLRNPSQMEPGMVCLDAPHPGIAAVVVVVVAAGILLRTTPSGPTGFRQSSLTHQLRLPQPLQLGCRPQQFTDVGI